MSLIERFLRAIRERFGLQILSAFMLIIAGMLALFTIFSVIREDGKAKEEIQEQGKLLSELLSHNALLGIFAENQAMLSDSAAGIMALKDVLSVSMRNAGFKELYSKSKVSLLKESKISAPETDADLTTKDSVEIRETAETIEFIRPVMLQTSIGKDETIFFDESFVAPPPRIIGYVSVTLSKERYHQEISSIIKRNGIVLLIFIFSAGAMVYFMVSKSIRPLEELTKSVVALGNGEHVEPISVEAGNEIGNLAAAFNAMVISIEKAERSVRQSEERYRRLVELSPDGIFVLEDERIVFINPAGVKLFGAGDSSELTVRSAYELIHPEDRERVIRRLFQAEQEGSIIPLLELRYVKIDGELFDAEVAVARFMNGERRAILVIARDVTERKSLEEKIQLYQEKLCSVASEMSNMESLIEERERHLIASDLHDFVGQNLIAVLLKIGLLRKSLKEPKNVAHLNDLKDLVKEIVQYTRTLTVELCPPLLIEIGLGYALHSIVEPFKIRHGMTVVISYDSERDRIDKDVRYLLFRSIRELLVNSVKHAQADAATVRLDETRSVFRVTVIDNGSGFDPALIASKQGGFGLFSIRERLKKEGGCCEIRSELGWGTEVILEVPIRRKRRTGAKRRQRTTHVSGPEKNVQPEKGDVL